jgi:hypothetical protein
MRDKVFNRDSAIFMEIKDADDPDQEHHIKRMLTVDGQLLIFSNKGIFRMLTADTIDPERLHSDTRHSYEKIYAVGASSVLVARTIIQFKEIFDIAIPAAERKEALLTQLWKCTKLLLECEKSHYHIYKHVMELMPICDEIVENNKTKANIPALPKIPDLNTHISDFLMNGKLLLVEIHRFLNEFFGMPFDGRNASHFDRHRQWIERSLGEQHPLHKMLSEDEGWIRTISECSNAIRHREVGQTVDVENISLKPGNKFSGPAWKYDLSKKGLGTQNHFTDVISDFEVYVHNMTTFFEEILLLSIDSVLKDNAILALCKKPIEQILADCPTVYMVGLKQSFRL